MYKQLMAITISLYVATVSCQTSPGTNTPVAGQKDSNTTAPAEIPRAPVEPRALNAGDLPAGAKYKGKLISAAGWRDSNGENILIQSLGDAQSDKAADKKYGEGFSRRELYALHYIKKDTAYTLLWSLIDFVGECDVDMTLDFLPQSGYVTDLDKNGLAETTVQYRLACRGDVSPATMKLIMHEGKEKYALRGLMVVPPEKPRLTLDNLNQEKQDMKGKDDYGQYLLRMGRYENERDFATAPPAFLAFAREKWLLHVQEKFE